jgi:hypothetical protein
MQLSIASPGSFYVFAIMDAYSLNMQRIEIFPSPAFHLAWGLGDSGGPRNHTTGQRFLWLRIDKQTLNVLTQHIPPYRPIAEF